ncbi:MAG: PorT family protein, partial [Myxococcales bacterium]|nr:PorT family protein [Myxococcales bacterium]
VANESTRLSIGATAPAPPPVEEPRRWFVGVHAAGSFDGLIANIDGLDLDPGPGFNAGLLGGWRFSDDWALRVEALFSMRMMEFDEADTGREGEWRWQSVELPVLAVWTSPWRFDLLAGLGAEMLLLAEEENHGKTEDVLDEHLGYEADAHLGIGLPLAIDPFQVRFELRGVASVLPVAAELEGGHRWRAALGADFIF